MERTHRTSFDEALQRLLTEPSYAAQTLIVTARMLELDAAQPVTGTARENAFDIAIATILTPLPEVVHNESRDRAREAFPPLTPISRGEYALQLRDAAKGL
ncbi:hypothetical protein ACFVFJ_44525 [Streptomyces sp. NPDC057717]|uniref:hypothetical protein n=1 Tax=Streptomyces sp. NPDC057717 TaxID=3346224 RepID=UPI0036C8F2EC